MNSPQVIEIDHAQLIAGTVPVEVRYSDRIRYTVQVPAGFEVVPSDVAKLGRAVLAAEIMGYPAISTFATGWTEGWNDRLINLLGALEDDPDVE